MYLDLFNEFEEKFREKYETLTQYIWDNPETAFEEYNSANALINHLEENGYKIEKNLAGIETAFSGEFGQEGPIIGFLGEFDALSGLSQVANCADKRPEKENSAGHGCGHNLLGVGSLIAADLLKSMIEEKGLKARVKYFGCPGEEGGSGKAFMARDGVFDDLDLAFSWHPMNTYEVWNVSSMANFQVYYKFKGISSHAAAAPHLGRSALDAVEIMNIGVQFLREHLTDDTRIHYAITNTGGYSPNVVQPYGEVLYLMRASDLESLFSLKERVDKIAKGAALMTETDLEIDFVKGCSNYITNTTMERQLEESLKLVPLPEVSSEDKELIDKLYESVKDTNDGFSKKINNLVADPDEREKYLAFKDSSLYNFVVPYKPSNELLFGSTDVSDVSWKCPTGQVFTATWPAKVAPHTWQATTMGKTNHALNTTFYAGKVLALTAIRMIENPELIEKAKKDFQDKLSGQEYKCPIPKGLKPRKIS